MFATGLIVFREVLEASLIIGIVMAATRGAERRGAWVIAGIGAGVLGATVVAGLADVIASALAGVGQELFNASVLFMAVIMLGWHNVWMKQHGRALTAQMNTVGRSVVEGQRPLYLLAVVVGLAVLREGSEVVLFLYGIAAGSETGAGAMLAGGLTGIAAGAALGFTMYLGLLRIPTRHLFTVTSWLILLLAAGMAAQGASFLAQAGILPPLGVAVWDTSFILSEHSIPGQILHTLVGYMARPDGIQILFYSATLITIGGLMRLVDKRAAAKSRTAASALAAVTLGAVLLDTVPDAHATHKVYSPRVEKGELEIEARGHIDQDSDDTKDGARKDKYEIGYGLTDWWFSSLFVEYERAAQEGLQREATSWENIFQLTDTGKYWMDTGLYLEYEKPADNGVPDKLEAKLLLEKTVHSFVHTANLVFEREIGNGAASEVEFGYAWRTKYLLRREFEPGIELYGNLGDIDDTPPASDQIHQAGPVVTGKYRIGGRSSIYYEAGYLFGLTSASPDGTVKWLLEYEYVF